MQLATQKMFVWLTMELIYASFASYIVFLEEVHKTKLNQTNYFSPLNNWVFATDFRNESASLKKSLMSFRLLLFLPSFISLTWYH